jgi:hypothetical protein
VINELIVEHVVEALQKALIDDIPDADPDAVPPILEDPAKAGVVITGPLQGNPDPDQARISVTAHENDPDNFYPGQITQITGDWSDEIAEVECGGQYGGAMWNRRFTVKARCLTVNTKEDLASARQIASKVKSRIERCLLAIDWAGVVDKDKSGNVIEYVSRPVASNTMRSEALQGGGPPDSYDYFIKVRFDVQTNMILGG